MIHQADPEVKCPAAEIVHPIFSRNPADAQCRVEGSAQPAEGSPCCGEYTKCRIWMYHVEIDRGPSTKLQRDHTLAEPRAHAA